MKLDKILKSLYSTRVMAVAVMLYAVAMALATFIENDFGTPTAKILIYNSKWFEFLMLLLVVNFIGNMFKYRLFRKEKWPVLLFHLAFVFILFAAGITRYFGYEGMMRIREGETENTILSNTTAIDVVVDDDSYQKTFSKEVLFGYVPKFFASHNSYHLSKTFNTENTPKTPFEVQLIRYTPNAKKIFVPDTKAAEYLHLVESSSGSRNDVFIKSGELKMINNVLISFNKNTKGAINITSNATQQTLTSPFDGDYMEMRTQKHFPIKKDSIMPLQLLKLHNFSGFRFVIKAIARGQVKTVVASKKESKMYPEDELVFEVSSGDKHEQVSVYGAKNVINPPKHIRLGKLNFNISYGSKELPLPFGIKLRDFELKKNPGSMSPSSFASEVTVVDKGKSFDYRIYMNHVLDYKGFRFFQASFDPDEKGTILSVNHDYWGSKLTYLGYLLMGIGMFFSMFWKGTRFQKLSEKLNAISKKKIASILLLLLTVSSFGQDIKDFTISKAHAEKFGRLQIEDYQGRVKPMNTYALEILRKVAKKDKYKGLTAEQVLLSAQLFPHEWAKEPIIKVKMPYALGSQLSNLLKIKDKRAALIHFFNKKGHYIIQKEVTAIYRKKTTEHTASDKALVDLDEQSNVWLNALEGNVMRIYPTPNDPTNTWYTGPSNGEYVSKDTMILKMHYIYLNALKNAVKSNDYTAADNYLDLIKEYQKNTGKEVYLSKEQVDLELKYNKLDIFFKAMFYFMLVGFILLFFTFLDLFKPNKKWIKLILNTLVGFTIIGVLILAYGLGLRWYVSGHAPWSNGYEATVFVAFVLTVAGLIFGLKRNKFIITAAVLFASFLLGIATLSMMNPQITPLVPVLKSYWLKIHVAIITGSYAFLGLSALLGFVNLLLYILRNQANKKRFNLQINELTYVSELTMTVGLYMLSIGTFLGGVWASESWGRYWSWDPKEVWSLISMMVYIFILHMRLIPGLQGKFAFNFASIIAIGTLIMTFFGVNYYLAGMHSYAKGDPIPVPVWIYYFVGFIVVFSIVAYSRYKKLKK